MNEDRFPGQRLFDQSRKDADAIQGTSVRSLQSDELQDGRVEIGTAHDFTTDAARVDPSRPPYDERNANPPLVELTFASSQGRVIRRDGLIAGGIEVPVYSTVVGEK